MSPLYVHAAKEPNSGLRATLSASVQVTARSIDADLGDVDRQTGSRHAGRAPGRMQAKLRLRRRDSLARPFVLTVRLWFIAAICVGAVHWLQGCTEAVVLAWKRKRLICRIVAGGVDGPALALGLNCRNGQKDALLPVWEGGLLTTFGGFRRIMLSGDQRHWMVALWICSDRAGSGA